MDLADLFARQQDDKNMARYTDAWLKTQFAPDPDRFTVHTPPDPGHGDKSDAQAPTIMMDAPVLQGGGEVHLGDSLFENMHNIAPPVRIDKTPIDGSGPPSERGHGYGGTTRPLSQDEGYGRGILGMLRGRDLGAAKRETSQFGRPYRFFNEQWFGTQTTGMEPPPITEGSGDRVLRRGLNAYPENDGDSGRPRAWTVNMPSWKRGLYIGSNVNRDFTPPHRTHGQVRMVRPDIVTIIGDAPPPDKPDKYASPFSSLQKFMPKRRKIRGIRRVPTPFDEDIVANAPDPFVSGGADGMIVL